MEKGKLLGLMIKRFEGSNCYSVWCSYITGIVIMNLQLSGLIFFIKFTSMKKLLPYLFCILFSFAGCKKQNHIPVDTQEFEQLKSKYGGRYQILSSIANDPVDLNLDGNTNTNLLRELRGIEQSMVTIRVIKDTDPRSTKNYITSFDLSYPEQYAVVDGKEISSYIPGAEVLFLDQPVYYRCLIDTVKNLINLLPENNPDETERRFTKPNDVRLLDGEKIQVSTIKEFYTKKGFIKVNITSIYERES